MSDIAVVIVNRIIMDLTDRGGLDNAWCEIDERTRIEIKDTWTSIIEEELER